MDGREGWRPGVTEYGGFRRTWQFTSIHQVQLDQDEKLGSVQLNMIHSKIGTSEILQSDKAPKGNKQINEQTDSKTSKYEGNNLHSLSSLGTNFVL